VISRSHTLSTFSNRNDPVADLPLCERFGTAPTVAVSRLGTLSSAHASIWPGSTYGVIRLTWNGRPPVAAFRAELRAKIDERHAERKVEQAQRNAADAEAYASGLVSMAAYVIDAAEYAVVDATIARSEADALVAGR
jgi:hypothetical protein